MKKLLLILSLTVYYLHPSAQVITTIAGNGTNGFSGDGGPATAAEIYGPNRVAMDALGNLYLSASDHRIRKVSTAGIITTLAGKGFTGFSGDGGPATAAELNSPYGICVDKSGNIYFADSYNNKVRKINTSGIISTIAGQLYYGYTGNGGPATAATLHYPEGVAIDTAGNLFIADNGNYVVREINTSGIISTIAGNGYVGYSGDGGPATAANLRSAADVSLDKAGNIYISDAANEVIRKVNTSGIISTYAGCGIAGSVGDGYPATTAGIYNPQGISADGVGNLYIADNYNHKIRKVNAFGIIYRVAGIGSSGFGGDGGPATAAILNYPSGVCNDAYNNIYIADANNSRIRKISLSFSDTVTAVSSSNCASCNGSATVTPSGGFPPYTYLWSPGGATNTTITGLCPGFYSVLIADSQNDSLKNKTVLVRSTILSDSMGENCAGCCNCHGMAGVKVFGGTAPYTYLWSNGGTTDTIKGLAGGTYTVTVTDNNGCTLVDTVFVTRGLHISVTVTNVACNGGNNGSATVSGPAGTSYTWQPGNLSGASVSGLGPGTYTVTATNTDSGGCSATLTFTINQPEPLQVTLNNSANCTLTDWMTASVIGGTPPYSYHWSTGGTGPSNMISLDCHFFPPPWVSVTVTDHNVCTAGAGIPIWVPFQFYSATQTNVSCNGGNNGSITVTACGSTQSGYFSITPGGTYYATSTYTFSNLTAGTYSVTVQGVGCPPLYPPYVFTITQPNALAVTATATSNVSCFGGSNGSTSSTVSGGTTAYTYSWSGGHGSNPTATGLSAGTYTLNVTDHNGCTGSATVIITQPTQLRDSISSQTNVKCFGMNTGSLKVGVKGGTPVYTYLWSPGGMTTQTVTGLSAGCYTVTVTDANSCSVTATSCITQPTQLKDSVCMIRNASCNGNSDGCLGGCVSGGTPPYTYNWTPTGGTSDSICNLTAGCYTITITDANGCTATATNCVTQPAALSAIIAANPDTICTSSCATINVTASGCSSAYNYLWSNGMTTSSINVCPTNTTTYTVQISCGACSWDSTVTITVNTCVGIPGIASGNGEALLYPNPNNGLFTLSISNYHSGIKQRIAVYNILGEMIYSDGVKSANTQINLSDRPSGIYMYRLLSETGKLVSEGKFVITK